MSGSLQRARAVALALICMAAASCQKPARHALTTVNVTGATARDNALLGVGEDEVRAHLRTALEKSGRFTFLEDGAKRPKDGSASSLTLELPFTRFAQKEGREGTWAEVGATLNIARKQDSETYRYQVVGLGEERLASDEDRPRAMREALESALRQVVSSADLQLRALDKPDKVLLSDLHGDDAVAQEFALRVLTERRNPAVSEVLIERLRTTQDPDQLRRMVGALAELREQKAVKPLIDLTRGRDPVFVREIIFALAQIGGEEAQAYLYTVAQGHDDPALREAARQALSEVRPLDGGPGSGAAAEAK